MNKGLKAFKELKNNAYVDGYFEEELSIIEKELKEGEKNKQMLNIFKNALTLEKKQDVILPQDASEDIFEYSVRTLIEIKHSELNKELKKELREWVLKNAFLKELKALEIIKEKIKFEEIKAVPFNNYTEYYVVINGKEIVFNQEEYDLLKEVLYVQEEKNRP